MNRSDRPVVVFDCMIYLQGLIKETGPAAECLEMFERGAMSLVVSNEILEEIADVLTHPKLQANYSRLTSDRADRLLEVLRENARLLENIPSHFKYLRDPKDEKYINAGIEARADYIVSRDNDLLDLMTSHTDEAKEFRQRFRHLKVVGPIEFLRIIRELDLALKP